MVFAIGVYKSWRCLSYEGIIQQMNSKIKIIIFPLGFAAVLFSSAGRFDLLFVWAYAIIFGIFTIVSHFTIDPGLLRERLVPGPGDKDILTRRLILPLILIHWLIAGLDIGRFHWSDNIPSWVQAVCITGAAVFLGLSYWAIRVNRFFSPALRIQQERGHHLITDGPYKYIRHPGYASGIFSLLLGGLALGSWWAMLPICAYIVVILRRTIIEDRFLQQNLDGYMGYSQKVPYRLIPHVW